MIKEIKIEKLQGTIKEGKVGKISKNAGDTVAAGDKILQVELKKGNFPIKSKVAGTVTEILVETGKKVKIGDVIAKIETAE